jgi:hypothetical protein
MTAALKDQSRRTNVVTEVIREIAARTNLLALNAAIEAASRGIGRSGGERMTAVRALKIRRNLPITSDMSSHSRNGKHIERMDT